MLEQQEDQCCPEWSEQEEKQNENKSVNWAEPDPVGLCAESSCALNFSDHQSPSN